MVNLIEAMMMKKKIIISMLVGCALLFLALAIVFIFKSNRLNIQVVQAKAMLQKMQEELARAQQEKEKAALENEKLQADTISYMGVSTKLQEEKNNLKESLEKSKKDMEAKEEELEKNKLALNNLEEKLVNEQGAVKKKLLEEKEALTKNLKDLDGTLAKERALYHYNLAVAYTQAKLYDEAIESYEKSLKFDPQNADSYYNLGLIYGNVKSEPDKAVANYKKYLELNPDADDKEEVQGWIENLR